MIKYYNVFSPGQMKKVERGKEKVKRQKAESKDQGANNQQSVTIIQYVFKQVFLTFSITFPKLI